MMNPLAKGRSLLRRWGDRWRRGAFVLLYHRVDTHRDDPFGLRVRPGRFEDQLAMLHERWHVVPLPALVAGMRAGESVEGCVAITFDDGYEDNLRVALPALEREDLPATVFVVSDGLAAEFWWDRLTRLWRSRRGEPSDDFRQLHRRLRGLPPGERTGALDALAAEPTLEEAAAPDPPARSVTPDELARLGAHDLIEIGAHTRTHPFLPDLDADAQRSEIVGSRTDLEDVLGRPVTGASYPFGGYDPISVLAATEGGFAYACAAMTGICTASTHLFEIPRFTVGDWTGEELDRHLQARSPASAAAAASQEAKVAEEGGPAGEEGQGATAFDGRRATVSIPAGAAARALTDDPEAAN
jgi:peptidoglycan/xylan/chitin deacetylase (PgdA/CDA1 family)